jgi:ribosomal protein S18 acetylase RimI-like enzyme
MLPIRKARSDDLPNIRQIVGEAYSPYVARIGRKPGPMLDDYAGRIAAGEVEVVDGSGGLDAILVLVPEEDALLLDNVAVANAARGKGLGGALIDHAEARARALGLPAVRLYTHELMTENQAIYRKRGYVETHRAEEEGLRRVFMSKAVQPGEGDG